MGYRREMIQPKTYFHRKHYSIGLAILLVALFITLYLFILPLQALDSQLVSSLPIQFPHLDGFMLAITTIGSPIAMPLIVFVWAGIEIAWKRRDRAIVMIASLVAAPIFYVLKAVIHRSRPETKFVELQHLHSYSFPSGHATMSFAVLLTLAYLLSLRLPHLWSRIVTTFLLLLVILIGISRVYLGAHYPTDVVGGWLIGGIVLLAIRAYVSSYEHISATRTKI